MSFLCNNKDCTERTLPINIKCEEIKEEAGEEPVCCSLSEDVIASAVCVSVCVLLCFVDFLCRKFEECFLIQHKL